MGKDEHTADTQDYVPVLEYKTRNLPRFFRFRARFPSVDDGVRAAGLVSGGGLLTWFVFAAGIGAWTDSAGGGASGDDPLLNSAIGEVSLAGSVSGGATSGASGGGATAGASDEGAAAGASGGGATSGASDEGATAAAWYGAKEPFPIMDRNGDTAVWLCDDVGVFDAARVGVGFHTFLFGSAGTTGLRDD